MSRDDPFAGAMQAQAEREAVKPPAPDSTRAAIGGVDQREARPAEAATRASVTTPRQTASSEPPNVASGPSTTKEDTAAPIDDAKAGTPYVDVQAPKRNGGGRPRGDRPHRVVGYVDDSMAKWITKREHAERADGSYFQSQSELVNRLLVIAREALDEGRVRL